METDRINGYEKLILERNRRRTSGKDRHKNQKKNWGKEKNKQTLRKEKNKNAKKKNKKNKTNKYPSVTK